MDRYGVRGLPVADSVLHLMLFTGTVREARALTWYDITVSVDFGHLISSADETGRLPRGIYRYNRPRTPQRSGVSPYRGETSPRYQR